MKFIRSLSRYSPWLLCVFGTFFLFFHSDRLSYLLPLGLLGFLTLLGWHDILQTRHSILRNYPVTGHLRFLLEYFRVEIRQYFIESDREKIPFSRNQRALVYQRSKRVSDQRPFGTINDVYAPTYEWLLHSANPLSLSAVEDLRVVVGQGSATQPYSMSVFNISAMSFGSLSANAIMALNKGAKLGGFAHDTGEGSVSKYHRVHGGDLVWELGSGYFGCRHDDGSFSLDKFTQVASDAQIKMIEIKLSQGAKPGHGGVLPSAKITPEIAETRGIPMGIDCVSPSSHSAFSNPVEMMHFVSQLREASGGKPVGIKLCIGNPKDWFSILKAMLSTGILLDFVTVDGGEGGTGSAPVEFADHVGMPFRDALNLVNATLIGIGLRDRVKIGAAGKIISSFDIMRACAIGADWCNAARGFMFAVGCIQSRACHTDRCPTGVATQDPLRQKALVPEDKAQRVLYFHQNTLHALKELLASAGVKHTRDIRSDMIMVRDAQFDARLLSTKLLVLEPQVLKTENAFESLESFQKGLGQQWLDA